MLEGAAAGSPVPSGRRLGIDILIAGLAAVFLYRSLWLPFQALRLFDADFQNYYQAAARWLAGLSPYEVGRFDYPPLTALIVMPVAWLPYPQARVAWLIVNWLCLAGSGVVLVRLLGGDRRAALAVVALWALGGTVPENLVLGQVNPVLLLLVVAAWWGARRNRSGLAAMAIGFATALKLWPGVLLAAVAPFHRRRAVAAGGAAVAFVVLSWLPLLGVPPPHSPTTKDYWLGTPALLNFSLPAVALRLADPPAAGEALPASWRSGNDPLAFQLSRGQGLLSAAVAGFLLVMGGAALWLAGRQQEGTTGTTGTAGTTGGRFKVGDAQLFALAAAVSLALAASPISWYHYQLLQLPGLALLACRWTARATTWRQVLFGLLALAALADGLTRTDLIGVGSYLGRYGWTAANLPWLWLSSSLVPILSLVHFGLQVREMRPQRRFAAVK